LLLGADTYHTAVDMWAIGCIFGELLKHRPLLPGKTELQQIELIFALLGTPNEKIWPGLSKLPGTASPLSHHPYNSLRHEFPQLSDNGIDLLSRLLTYGRCISIVAVISCDRSLIDPSKRMTAEKALDHLYFSESPLPTSPDMMPTFPSQSSVLDSKLPLSSTTSSLSSSESAAAAIAARSAAAAAIFPPSNTSYNNTSSGGTSSGSATNKRSKTVISSTTAARLHAAAASSGGLGILPPPSATTALRTNTSSSTNSGSGSIDITQRKRKTIGGDVT
jgi:serine/threonine protein kinase